MDNWKWLKRKYPSSFEELREYFNSEQLQEFKVRKRKIGRLNNDYFNVVKYEKNTIIQFKRTNPMDYNYPAIYCVAKCGPELTASSYHGFDLYSQDLTEIKS